MFGGAPSPPKFQPAAFTPAAPAQTVSPQPVAPFVPNLTGPKATQQGMQEMGLGPSWLNLNNYNGNPNPSAPGGQGGPFNPQLMQQMSNWYMQNQVLPQVSAEQSAGQSSGQNYGSYAPAMAGQMYGEGQQQAFQAALAANQQQYQDVLGGIQSFYQNPVALAANQSNFNSQQANQYDLGVAQLADTTMLGNQQSLNNYDLGVFNGTNQFALGNTPNQFNAENYGTEMSGYNNMNSGLFGLGGQALSSAPGIIGSYNPLTGAGSGLAGLLGGP
jgi:hypothetical protein